MWKNHAMFAETEGGRALWKNREMVQSLLDRKIGRSGPDSNDDASAG